MLLLIALAQALPPSTTLSGSNGTLKWTVTPSSTGVTIDGSSPKWTVHHQATASLQPIHTERRSSEGHVVVIDYSADKAVFTLDGKQSVIEGDHIWDGDVFDIRMGQLVAQGKTEVTFQAIDPDSGTLYGFHASLVGAETCGNTPCQHIHLGMTGMYRLVGPSWEYWYGSDGKLLRFEADFGKFSAN